MTMHRRVLLFTTADAHHFGTAESEINDSVNIFKLRALSGPAVIDFMIHSEWEDILYLYESTECKFTVWVKVNRANSANYRLRWILEKASRQVPMFTVDFRMLRWKKRTPEPGDFGLLQHINHKTNTFHRKSVLIDLSSHRGSREVIRDIGALMQDRADLHFFIIGGVSDVFSVLDLFFSYQPITWTQKATLG